MPNFEKIIIFCLYFPNAVLNSLNFFVEKLLLWSFFNMIALFMPKTWSFFSYRQFFSFLACIFKLRYNHYYFWYSDSCCGVLWWKTSLNLIKISISRFIGLYLPNSAINPNNFSILKTVLFVFCYINTQCMLKNCDVAKGDREKIKT